MGGGLGGCAVPLRWGGVALVRCLGAPSVAADHACGGAAGTGVDGTAVSIRLRSGDSAISGMKTAGRRGKSSGMIVVVLLERRRLRELGAEDKHVRGVLTS